MPGWGPRLRDRPALVGSAVALAVVETALVWGFGPHSGLALAPQVSAPAPYDVFHDLRWLFVYEPGWLAFVLELALLLAFRTVATAWFVHASWPRGLPPLDPRSLLRRSLASTAILALVLTPWVILIYVAAVVSLSWLVLVAVPVTVVLALLMHHGTVTARWWHEPPARGSVLPTLLAFAGLMTAGAVLATGPAWLRIPAAAGAGALNAWCWLRITHALAGREVQPRRRPFVLIGLVALVVVIVAGTAAGFAVSTALEHARAQPPRADPNATGPPVLVVKGFNSRWDGSTLRWVRGNFLIRRFSYAGLDDDGVPRPYNRAATHQSVRALALDMRVQVDALVRDAGRPVGIVAESEGSLVALTYLMGTPDAPVRSLVALSPLLEPGRVFYPRLGRSGWGTAAGAVIEGMAAALGAVGPVDVSADTPLFRSMVEEGPALRGLLRCPVRGVRQLAVLPLDSAAAAPSSLEIAFPYTVRPAIHGGLLGDGTTARLVARTLRGERVDTGTVWRSIEGILQAGFSAWQTPSLMQSLEPRWRHLPDPDDCRGVRQALRHWLASG
jgi:hypothetical protein